MAPLTRTQLSRLNIGKRYWPADVSRIPDDCAHKAIVRKYVENLPRMRKGGFGLMLWGPNSTGKTYGASALLKAAVREGFTGYCLPASDLAVALIEKRQFDEDQTVAERAMEVDFLVIEDLGKEFRGKSGWATLQFENTLRRRTRELLPTIITTNLSPAGLREVYDESALQLALEMMYPFQCKGTNFRDGIARRMKEIIDP